MTYEIRHAYESDIPSILEMITELAIYEKEPDAVEATPETLRSTLAFSLSPGLPPASTSPTRPARCLIVLDDGKPAGIALYFYNYSTWRSKPGIYLEDLFVRPEFRGKGYGKMLLGTLAKEVKEMDGGRLDWIVLKWNEPSIKFYEGIGARIMDEWVGMRMEGEVLGRLAEAVE